MEAKLGTVTQAMIFDMHREGVSLLHIIRSSEIRNVFYLEQEYRMPWKQPHGNISTLMPYGYE
jgi:hypothetical protein